MALALGCTNSKTSEPEDEGVFNYESFSGRFKEATLPYHLSDSDLVKIKDTATIRNQVFLSYIPDSISTRLFGKGAKVKYVPLARINASKTEDYFIVKGTSGKRQAAVLVAIKKQQETGTAFPLLAPDNDSKTSQASSIDKALSITRSIITRGGDEGTKEGKDVYVYNSGAGQFTLIMTDVFDEGALELINPIDTFARTHKFAGDYTKGKRNIVSIRDGRNEHELNVFIHFEEDDGACTGEVKGTAFFTSSKTAVYRQGGDPCVLEIEFGTSSVRLREVEGCGARRGLECSFDGSYTKKKESKAKTSVKKGKND